MVKLKDRKAFQEVFQKIAKQPQDIDLPLQSELGPHLNTRGWKWEQHPILPDYAFLSKRNLPRRFLQQQAPAANDTQQAIQEEEWLEEVSHDGAKVQEDMSGTLFKVDLYIVYSPSFQVPVLYFDARQYSGAPISLQNLLGTTFFQRHANDSYPLKDMEHSADRFPVISQGDHPVTNLPCHFLHPCETSAMLEEIMGSQSEEATDIATTWMMLVGSIINLKDM